PRCTPASPTSPRSPSSARPCWPCVSRPSRSPTPSRWTSPTSSTRASRRARWAEARSGATCPDRRYQVAQIHGRPAGPRIRCQHERGGDGRPGTDAGEGAGGEDFDLDSEVLVSAAIAWEISTKVRIGKLPEASADRVFDDLGTLQRIW